MNRPRILTKAIPLNFVASSVSRPVYINVPFRVEKIKTKSMVYQDLIDPIIAFEYVYITSDLVKGQPLGVQANDYRLASFSGADDIIYKSQNPIDINGSYTFYLMGSDGNPQTASASVLLLLEFTESEQTALNNF